MILKVPNRTPQKVKLRNTVSTLGTSFRDPFADLFGKMLTKQESQIEARSRRLGHLLTWFWDVTCSHVRDHLTGTGITFTLRAACFAGHSLVYWFWEFLEVFHDLQLSTIYFWLPKIFPQLPFCFPQLPFFACGGLTAPQAIFVVSEYY